MSVTDSGRGGLDNRVGAPAIDTDIERRAYRTLNEDGLVDVGVGLGLLAAALYIGLPRPAGTSTAAWSGLAPILIIPRSSFISSSTPGGTSG